MWIPLENNPEMYQNYAKELFGMNIQVEDIWGAECIQQHDFIILLFHTSYQKGLYETMKPSQSSLVHLTQDICNSCGTMALLHCLINSNVEPTLNQQIFEKIKAEKHINGIKIIEELHDKYADKEQQQPEQTQENGQQVADENIQKAVPIDMETQLHFVVFKRIENKVFLLDGRINEIKEFSVTNNQEIIDLVLKHCPQFEMQALRFVE
uniref:ubiquitinyl hydrolase 1 n=1 Tax=Trepomonas sp. PC1 TaxID=1076344 RepID=A0A146KGX7_9EUKA|eukprot:JAP95942.1 Ubiquitin carboxyl-terminal hydrolase [Trepomonas sp. PC1]